MTNLASLIEASERHAKTKTEKDRERYDGATIVNGPDRFSLMTALFEGTIVCFKFEGHHRSPPLRIWSVRCHDSDRRNWTITGEIIDGDSVLRTQFEARYWLRGDGSRRGTFKIC